MFEEVQVYARCHVQPQRRMLEAPLLDLAALTAGWTEERRQELALSYYAETDPRDPGWLPLAALTRPLARPEVDLVLESARPPAG